MDAKLSGLQQILEMIQDAASSKYKPDEKGEVVLLRVGGKQGDEIDNLDKKPSDEPESTAEKVAEQVIGKMLGKEDDEDEDDWADKLLKE